MIRKKLIAGNWKMNKTSPDALTLSKEIVDELGKVIDVEIVVCPPFTALETVGKIVDGTSVKLGAQNMHPEANGAYTGEIAAPVDVDGGVFGAGSFPVIALLEVAGVVEENG